MVRIQRKKRFIHRGVQGGLLIRQLLHWLTFSGLTALVLCLLQVLNGDPTQVFSERIAEAVPELKIIGIVMVLLFPAFAYDSIKFSHRFTGSLYRLNRHLSQLAETGQGEPCSIRTDDFWHELVDRYNEVLDLVEKQQREIEALKERDPVLHSCTEERADQLVVS